MEKKKDQKFIWKKKQIPDPKIFYYKQNRPYSLEKSFLKLNTHFQKVRDLEMEILKYSGLTLGKDVKLLDIPLTIEKKSYVHAITCGHDNYPPLLILHG